MGVAEAVASRPDESLPLVALGLGSAARSAAWASWAWADDGPAAVESLESAEPEPCAGTARFDVAGVTNEAGNVFGLMPHPEHAVDPLLGSTDGGLVIGSLVDAARLSAGAVV